MYVLDSDNDPNKTPEKTHLIDMRSTGFESRTKPMFDMHT